MKWMLMLAALILPVSAAAFEVSPRYKPGRYNITLINDTQVGRRVLRGTLSVTADSGSLRWRLKSDVTDISFSTTIHGKLLSVIKGDRNDQDLINALAIEMPETVTSETPIGGEGFSRGGQQTVRTESLSEERGQRILSISKAGTYRERGADVIVGGYLNFDLDRGMWVQMEDVGTVVKRGQVLQFTTRYHFTPE